MTNSLSQELKWRGLINQTTLEDLSRLDQEEITFYWGVDPSASSMTIGNLAGAMLAKHFINHGHKAVLLVGGATGMIGDPDGKSEERQSLDADELEKNKQGIAEQYKRLFEGQDFEIVDNIDWFSDFKYLDFLKQVGKHVPMRQMLSRDFVQARLKEGGAGISYAEFSYVLIQAYDFLHLFREKGVTLQICGSDQWGNSVAGVDLIRRVTSKQAHVFSMPLVINKSTGKKFGKTEDGAVWLDPETTSVFKFYQFWLNADDTGVEEYLKIYTLLSKEEVERVITEFRTNPGARTAQKTLAYEVTKIVHGLDRADAAVKATSVLFGNGDFSSLSDQEVSLLEAELPTAEAAATLAESMVRAGLADSNSAALRLINDGAVTINGRPAGPDNQLSPGKNLIKSGKNRFALVINNN